MRKRASGSGKPCWTRAEPQEIAPSAAAPEPSGGSSEPVFRDGSELAGGWQSRPAGDMFRPLAGATLRQGKNDAPIDVKLRC